MIGSVMGSNRVKVLFFGRVREALDCAALSVAAEEVGHDLDGLEAWLVASRGERWRVVLAEDNLIRAVNQTVVTGNVPITENDEVAFFPPVTGG